MRIAKLFAYLALAIFLPLWLFNLSDLELNKKEKNNEKEGEVAKPITSIQNGGTQYNFNVSHLDSLFKVLTIPNQSSSKTTKAQNKEDSKSEKSNQQSPIIIQAPYTANEELKLSFQELKEISASNLQVLKEIMNKEKNITVNLQPNSNDQKPDDINNLTENIPVYDLFENGPFKFWEVYFINDKNSHLTNHFFVINNTSKTDTAYIDNIDSTFYKDYKTQIKIKFNYLKNIPPKSHIVIQYHINTPSQNFRELYTIRGKYPNKRKQRTLEPKQFNIPLIITSNRKTG